MIHWNVNPDLLHIGFFRLRWYSLMFMASFYCGFLIMNKIYKREGRSEKDLNDIFVYVFIGTLVGARLGHCLFYEPGYYLSHPFEILKVWRGGLASHGAAVGILTAIYVYIRTRKGLTYLWVVDRVVITVALSGFFIRLGNLFNSEIIGKPTDLPWSFVFVRVDALPRHPTQLYEAFAYLLVFFLLWRLYEKFGPKCDGLLFGTFLVTVFAARFLIEFVKKNQEAFEAGMVLNMGQLLSIPLILLGIILLVRSLKIVRAT